jgi:hypothetical protein
MILDEFSTFGNIVTKMWGRSLSQVSCRPDNSMDAKLSTIRRNLAPLEALKDGAKLRVFRSDVGVTRPLLDDGASGAAQRGVDDTVHAATSSAAATTVATHHLAVEDRWVLQGPRRAITGDGHRLTITFVRHLIQEIEALANQAFQTHTAADLEAGRRDLEGNMFALHSLEILQALSTSILAANKGLVRLKHTTYVENEQIGVDLSDLTGSMNRIAQRINTYLLTAASNAPQHA